MRTVRLAAICFLLLFISCSLHALERQPNAVYQGRREALARELHGGVALLFGNNDPSLEYQDFRQDEDFYYLTGWNGPGAALLISDAQPAQGGKPAQPYLEVLFLPERDLHMERYTGPKLDAASPNVTDFTGVREVRQLRELPAILAGRGLHNMWTQAGNTAAASALTFVQSTLGTDDLVSTHDVRDLTTPLRSVKDDGEIELLRKAADASRNAQIAAIVAIHPGINERAISGVITARCWRMAASGPPIPPSSAAA